VVSKTQGMPMPPLPVFCLRPQYKIIQCYLQDICQMSTRYLQPIGSDSVYKDRGRGGQVFTITIVHIGKSVRAHRTQRFMTQEEFAKFVGLSRDHLGRIERNEHEPHFSTIKKLADKLGVEPSHLVDQDSEY
jgi:DNA-binding XRE family transcriptional regulator